MKKKPELKLGDEFWFYDSFGELNAFPFIGWSEVSPDRAILPLPHINIHWRAIQGIVRKVPKKRRVWWIKPEQCPAIFECKNGSYCRTTPPEDKTGWICVREVKA